MWRPGRGFPEGLSLKILCFPHWCENPQTEAKMRKAGKERSVDGGGWRKRTVGVFLSGALSQADKTGWIIRQKLSVPLTGSVKTAEVAWSRDLRLNVARAPRVPKETGLKVQPQEVTCLGHDYSPKWLAWLALNSWQRKRKHQERLQGDRQKFKLQNQTTFFLWNVFGWTWISIPLIGAGDIQFFNNHSLITLLTSLRG